MVKNQAPKESTGQAFASAPCLALSHSLLLALLHGTLMPSFPHAHALPLRGGTGESCLPALGESEKIIWMDGQEEAVRRDRLTAGSHHHFSSPSCINLARLNFHSSSSHSTPNYPTTALSTSHNHALPLRRRRRPPRLPASHTRLPHPLPLHPSRPLLPPSFLHGPRRGGCGTGSGHG